MSYYKNKYYELLRKEQQCQRQLDAVRGLIKGAIYLIKLEEDPEWEPGQK